MDDAHHVFDFTLIEKDLSFDELFVAYLHDEECDGKNRADEILHLQRTWRKLVARHEHKTQHRDQDDFRDESASVDLTTDHVCSNKAIGEGSFGFELHEIIIVDAPAYVGGNRVYVGPVVVGIERRAGMIDDKIAHGNHDVCQVILVELCRFIAILNEDLFKEHDCDRVGNQEAYEN